MDFTKLATICNRLAEQLDNPSLDSYQLLDIATALMLMRHDLIHALTTQHDTGTEHVTAGDLEASLHWVTSNAYDSSTQELRDHVAVAIKAAIASISLLQHRTGIPQVPTDARGLDRKSARAS